MNKLYFKKTLCAFVLALSIIITGCAAVPQSVQEEIDAYKTIEEINVSVQYAPFEDVISANYSAADNIGQFITKGVIARIPQHDSQINSFELNYRTSDPDADLANILSTQYSGIDPNTLSAISNEAYKFVYSDTLCAAMLWRGDGSMRLLWGETFGYYDYQNTEAFQSFGLNALSSWNPADYFEAEKIISLHSGETIDPSLSYDLPGGNVKVADAVQTATNYLNNTFAQYEDNQFTYRIRKVYIRKISDGLYGYEFSAERIYNGIPIDTTTLYKPDGADIGGENYCITEQNHIYIWTVAADKIDFFFCASRKSVVDPKENDREILTMDSAMKILSSTLTSEKIFRVNSIELLYISGYYADEPISAMTTEGAAAFISQPRPARLVWAVLVDDPSLTQGTLDYPHDPHHSFFVDAFSGEVMGYCEGQYVY